MSILARKHPDEIGMFIFFRPETWPGVGGGGGGLSLGRGSRHCVEWLHGVEPRELLPPVHQDLRRMFEFLEQ